MFKKNIQHQQPALISAASELPEKQRERLETSWAGTFYKEFFSRMNEETFSVLYSDLPSRPNVPVNVLVGLEALKAGNGWSDAEMYEHYCYDLQVRYALGYDRLGDGDFEIRSLYYFRQRLSQYNAKTGENLLEKAFEQITDAQIVDLKVRTGMQRMDSTQIASNIVSASRLQLLVTAIQRVEHILNEVDKVRLAESFAPYVKDSAGHYTYRVKGPEAVQEHLQKIGQTIHALLADLKNTYSAESAYQVLERIFADNFHLLAQSPQGESGPKAKENKELSSGCLQSVDDLEASYRTKGTGHYKGYVANLTETCDPTNEIQLITKIQVAPNTTDDCQLLAEALPNLKQRTKLETIYTDGGHGGPATDAVLQEQQVEHIQTAIRGRTPNPEKLNLADFTIKFNEDSQPVKVTCPQGQTETVHSTSQKKAFVAHFTAEVCQICPLADKCPTRPGSRDPRHHLRFTQAVARASERRRYCQEQRKDGRNLRAAVEASMRSLKYPFRAGKLPVRGKFRVTSMLIGSASISNMRRIQRYQQARSKTETAQQVASGADKCTQEQAGDSFWAFVKTTLAAFSGLARPKLLAVGC
jgi:hypothetical protein